MTKEEVKERLVDLEVILVSKLRPTFLIITDPDLHYEGDIYIMISTIAFQKMPVQKRINTVFSLISKHVPDILEDRLIVVQAFSGKEIEDVIDDAFSEDNF